MTTTAAEERFRKLVLEHKDVGYERMLEIVQEQLIRAEPCCSVKTIVHDIGGEGWRFPKHRIYKASGKKYKAVLEKPVVSATWIEGENPPRKEVAGLVKFDILGIKEDKQKFIPGQRVIHNRTGERMLVVWANAQQPVFKYTLLDSKRYFWYHDGESFVAEVFSHAAPFLDWPSGAEVWFDCNEPGFVTPARAVIVGTDIQHGTYDLRVNSPGYNGHVNGKIVQGVGQKYLTWAAYPPALAGVKF